MKTLATAQIKLNGFPIGRRVTTIDILLSSDKRILIMRRLRPVASGQEKDFSA